MIKVLRRTQLHKYKRNIEQNRTRSLLVSFNFLLLLLQFNFSLVYTFKRLHVWAVFGNCMCVYVCLCVCCICRTWNCFFLFCILVELWQCDVTKSVYKYISDINFRPKVVCFVFQVDFVKNGYLFFFFQSFSVFNCLWFIFAELVLLNRAAPLSEPHRISCSAAPCFQFVCFLFFKYTKLKS